MGCLVIFVLLIVCSGSVALVSDVTAYPLSRVRLTQLASLPLQSLHADTAALSIPRVAGTPGAQQAREYLISKLPSSFNVTLDSFSSPTVLGTREFTNIVATFNGIGSAARDRRIVFAAHYDSKLMGGFVGSIDSAVPCAMLLDIAQMISKSDTAAMSWGFQLVFFDGEEAFREWTATDSLYGSRHLAALWSTEGSPNALEKISLFVLLDLIGTTDTAFSSMFAQTSLQFKVFWFWCVDEQKKKSFLIVCFEKRNCRILRGL
jgi:hypothetical protein